MNIRRSPLLGGCVAFVGMPFAGLVQAQSDPKVTRIGFLSALPNEFCLELLGMPAPGAPGLQE